MTDPTAGNSRTLPSVTSPYIFTGYIVDVLNADGTWRSIQDRAGEPEIFLTEASARDVAQAWAIHANVETRIRDLVTGEIVPSALELAEMADALDTADPRPELSDYAAWIAEGIEAVLEMCLNVVEGCKCETGCPSCVGTASTEREAMGLLSGDFQAPKKNAAKRLVELMLGR